MILRFSKLQDILGTKIFGLLLAALGENADALIDKLNKLERLNYIADINWWMDLREMRNQFAHDDLIHTHLILLITRSKELLAFWDSLKTKTIDNPVFSRKQRKLVVFIIKAYLAFRPYL